LIDFTLILKTGQPKKQLNENEINHQVS
jgi:hypothetical protein